MINVLYVPLDERPCNLKYPKLLSKITDNINLLVPSKKYMGKLKNPADVNKVWNFIFENAKECKYAILSIDMLIYGNIINSRIHHKSKIECDNLLNNLKKIKEINPEIEIHAFNLVARVANYNSSAEDPDYWKYYGAKIWKYSYCLDKISRGKASEDEIKEIDEIKKEIPEDIIKDFLDRRDVDRYINLKCVDFVKDNIIDYLVVPKDDTAEFGYAAMDQMAIARKVYELNIMDRVMVYPGADEVGCVLFSRVFNKIKNYCPKIYTRYSSTLGPTVIPRYEDRPLNEGIKAQITSLGGICVNTPNESDFMFAVNSPGKFMIECCEQKDKDLTYYSHVNLHEFIKYINYYIEKYKKPVAVADVAFSNGADNEFMAYANKVGLLEKIDAYGGWNTSENTNGMCLSHADICSYYEANGWKDNKKILSTEFLVRKIIEDWLFQANTIYELLGYKGEFKGIDVYNLADYEERVIKIIESLINKHIKKEFNGKFRDKKIEFSNLNLPWDRIFDIDFDLKLI